MQAAAPAKQPEGSGDMAASEAEPTGREWLKELLSDMDPGTATPEKTAQRRDKEFRKIRDKLAAMLAETGIKETMRKALAGLEFMPPQNRPKNPYIFIQRTLGAPMDLDIDSLRCTRLEYTKPLAAKKKLVEKLQREIRRVQREIREADSDSDDPGL